MLSELYKLKDAEIRSICKDRIESLEHWLRRLIDDTLSHAYGDYFGFMDDKGNRLISAKLSTQIEERQAKEPMRYPRQVDAILLEDAVGIICKLELYKKHFCNALANAFPDGQAEARTFLTRLLIPRNNLSHANAISHRAAEQIICYSNDVIESIKQFYIEVGMQQEYNVPLILKVTDSFGNALTRSQFHSTSIGENVVHLNNDSRFSLHPSDVLAIELEIDPSFDPNDYDLRWHYPGMPPEILMCGEKAVIPITNKQVGSNFHISFHVVSNKDWHRMNGGVDDYLIMVYKVLPPIE